MQLAKGKDYISEKPDMSKLFDPSFVENIS